MNSSELLAGGCAIQLAVDAALLDLHGLVARLGRGVEPPGGLGRPPDAGDAEGARGRDSGSRRSGSGIP